MVHVSYVYYPSPYHFGISAARAVSRADDHVRLLLQNEFLQFRLFLVKLLLPIEVHLTESEKPKRWGKEKKGEQGRRGRREGERKMGREEEGKKDREATGYFCR